MRDWAESYKAMFKDIPAPSEEEIERLHKQWLEANPEWLKLWEAHKAKLVVSPTRLKEIGQYYENLMTWSESTAEGEGIRCKVISRDEEKAVLKRMEEEGFVMAGQDESYNLTKKGKDYIGDKDAS